MVREAFRNLAFGFVLVALAGCGWLFGGDDDEIQPAPPIPNVTGLETRVINVKPGEKVEVEIRMTDAAGQPFEPYEFHWWSQIHKLESGSVFDDQETILCGEDVLAEAPSTGVHRLSFVAGMRGQCMIQARVKTCGGRKDTPCVETLSAELGPVFVNIMGGETDSIAPLQPSVTIVPGEIRPVSAIPMLASDAQGLVYPSGESWTIAVKDQSVAVVDGGRRVRGVAPGTTTLEFHSGDAVATIPLNVVEGTVSAPPDGRHRLEIVDFDGITDTGDIRGVPVTLTYPKFSHKHRMALDPKGWPSAVFEASAVGVQWHAVLHTEWTGSGFGIQQVGEYNESYWQPQYAVDDAGVRYLAMQTTWQQGLYMAVQKPGDVPGEWKLTQLPRRLDIDGAVEPVYSVLDVQIDMDRELMSIQARRGGGAWLAYLVWAHDATDPETPCVRFLRLATATANGVEVQDVEELRFAEGVHGCEATAKINALDVKNLLVLPPDPGRNLPRILLLEGELNVSYSYPRVYEASGAGWQRSDWPREGLGDVGIYTAPVQAAVPRPVPEGESPRLVWTMNLDTDSDAFEMAYFGSDMDDGPYPACFCDPGSPVELFALQNDGNVWVGDGNLSPLIKFTRDGRMAMDRPELLAPIEGGTAEAAATNAVFGWFADDSRFYFLTNHSGNRLDLVTLTPPTMAHEGATDAAGALLGDLYTADALDVAPVEMADGAILANAGARFDLAEIHELDRLSGLWRAEPPTQGSGATWSKAMTPIPTAVFEAPRQFFQVPGDSGRIYGIMREQNTGNDLLVESNDGGTTWTNRRQLAGFVFRAVQVGRGLAFVTHQPVAGADGGRPTEVGIWYLADMTAAAPAPVELAARVAVPYNQYSEIGSRLNILSTSDGFMVIMALDTAWRSGMLDIRRYDASGTLVDSWTTGVREKLELDVSTAVAIGDSGLMMLRWEAMGPGAQYVAYHSSDLFRTESSSVLPAYWEPPIKTVRFNDGRVAVLGTWNVEPDMERAAWCITTDGQSWSEPSLLRPNGGYDQEIWGAIPTADGDVVIIMGDNQMMRANDAGLNQSMTGVALRVPQPAAK